MKTLTTDYLDDLELALGLTSDDFAPEARSLLAYKLFELGRLTSGQAARLAGIVRSLFLLPGHPYSVACVSWDAEELAAERVARS